MDSQSWSPSVIKFSERLRSFPYLTHPSLFTLAQASFVLQRAGCDQVNQNVLRNRSRSQLALMDRSKLLNVALKGFAPRYHISINCCSPESPQIAFFPGYQIRFTYHLLNLYSYISLNFSLASCKCEKSFHSLIIKHSIFLLHFKSLSSSIYLCLGSKTSVSTFTFSQSLIREQRNLSWITLLLLSFSCPQGRSIDMTAKRKLGYQTISKFVKIDHKKKWTTKTTTLKLEIEITNQNPMNTSYIYEQPDRKTIPVLMIISENQRSLFVHFSSWAWFPLLYISFVRIISSIVSLPNPPFLRSWSHDGRPSLPRPDRSSFLRAHPSSPVTRFFEFDYGAWAWGLRTMDGRAWCVGDIAADAMEASFLADLKRWPLFAWTRAKNRLTRTWGLTRTTHLHLPQDRIRARDGLDGGGITIGGVSDGETDLLVISIWVDVR